MIDQSRLHGRTLVSPRQWVGSGRVGSDRDGFRAVQRTCRIARTWARKRRRVSASSRSDWPRDHPPKVRSTRHQAKGLPQFRPFLLHTAPPESATLTGARQWAPPVVSSPDRAISASPVAWAPCGPSRDWPNERPGPSTSLALGGQGGRRLYGGEVGSELLGDDGLRCSPGRLIVDLGPHAGSRDQVRR